MNDDTGISPGNPSSTIADADVLTDEYSMYILPIGGASNQTTTSMFDSNNLENVLETYYQMYAAQLALDILMNSASNPWNGTATLLEHRLLVSPLSCHFMAALLVISGLLCLAIMMSPSRIHGVATSFYDQAYFRQDPVHFGLLDSKDTQQTLSSLSYYTTPKLDRSFDFASHFRVVAEAHLSKQLSIKNSVSQQPKAMTPMLLHPASRILISLVLVGIILALGWTLHISNTKTGLGEAGSSPFTHFLWTSLPALVFTMLSLISGSMTSAILSFTTYLNMKVGAGSSRSIDLNLLDASMPISLFRAVRLGNLAAVAASLGHHTSSPLKTSATQTRPSRSRMPSNSNSASSKHKN